jgi:hypothetical protein
MNRGEIRAEVRSRGYDYISDSRLNLWIKQAYEYVCSLEPWWFLETSVSGQAPLALADLSQVLYVSYGDVSLRGADWRDIRDMDPGLDDTGTPVMWYLDGQTIKTWPDSTESLDVRYIRNPPALASDSDSPLVPEAQHPVLVDLAVISGLKDNDEYEQAQGLQAVVDRSIQDLRDQIMVRQYQNPTQMVQTRHPDDYIA